MAGCADLVFRPVRSESVRAALSARAGQLLRALASLRHALQDRLGIQFRLRLPPLVVASRRMLGHGLLLAPVAQGSAAPVEARPRRGWRQQRSAAGRVPAVAVGGRVSDAALADDSASRIGGKAVGDFSHQPEAGLSL